MENEETEEVDEWWWWTEAITVYGDPRQWACRPPVTSSWRHHATCDDASSATCHLVILDVLCKIVTMLLAWLMMINESNRTCLLYSLYTFFYTGQWSIRNWGYRDCNLQKLEGYIIQTLRMWSLAYSRNWIPWVHRKHKFCKNLSPRVRSLFRNEQKRIGNEQVMSEN